MELWYKPTPTHSTTTSGTRLLLGALYDFKEVSEEKIASFLEKPQGLNKSKNKDHNHKEFSKCQEQ